jgi:hypothetical protein
MKKSLARPTIIETAMQRQKIKAQVLTAQTDYIALSCFISRLGEKGLPFFKLLKAQEKFTWLDYADIAFAELKQFPTKPPILTAPQQDETLLVYITTTNCVVSTAIVVEREEAGHAYKV